jgi:lantibiotic leader peptide-processing serine protease
MSTHVIGIAATGPMGMALSFPNEPAAPNGYDRPASYTNYGQSAVDFAAPGGDFALPGNAPCTLPLIPAGTITAPCWVFDMVISTVRGAGPSISSYAWAAGTSMAAPAAAGVAASSSRRTVVT